MFRAEHKTHREAPFPFRVQLASHDLDQVAARMHEEGIKIVMRGGVPKILGTGGERVAAYRIFFVVVLNGWGSFHGEGYDGFSTENYKP